MSMHTGENEEGLRKIMDMTRLMSIATLLIHFYFYCYSAFEQWKLTAALSDRILQNIQRSGLFHHFHTSKVITLVLLAISLIGTKGRKKEKLKFKSAASYIVSGLLVYFGSGLLFITSVNIESLTIAYIGLTSIGFLFVLSGGTLLSRIIKQKINTDIFNKINETFPQEERLLQNEYSINLPAEYNLKNKKRKSWINIINPFRGLLVIGSPGAGKSYFVIRHIIRQQTFIFEMGLASPGGAGRNRVLSKKNFLRIPIKLPPS